MTRPKVKHPRIPHTIRAAKFGPRVEHHPTNKEGFEWWFEYGSGMGAQGFKTVDELSKTIVPWIRKQRVDLLSEQLALDLAEQHIRDLCTDATK